MLAFTVSGVDLNMAGETLGIAAGIYLVLLSTGKILKRQVGVRLGQVYQLFSLTVGAYLALSYFYPWVTGRRELGALAALFGTGVFVRLVDQYFWRWYFEGRRKVPVPKFIREVTGALLLIIVVLLVIQYGNGKPIPGCSPPPSRRHRARLRHAGFAGNIIAGFALQFGRPFQVGDWLLIDGQHVQAVEINLALDPFRDERRRATRRAQPAPSSGRSSRTTTAEGPCTPCVWRSASTMTWA